jgi:NADH-quinone oxidoreductase subunit I
MIGRAYLREWRNGANFRRSYFEKERLITVQYPEGAQPLPENYSEFSISDLRHDERKRVALCGVQDLRERNARRRCIYIVKAKTRSPITWASRSFYPASLRYRYLGLHELQICVEVCPFEAIKMDKGI